MQYEYEMFFDDNSPISIHGWYPIATDRIKDQSRIQEYIDKGILRRIDMKEQDAAHSLIENKFYWIKIQQWKDRDTRIEDKWSVAKWDGESFEELNEMYRIEEVIEISEQIPSNDELARLRSELQQKDEETTALKMKSEAQLQSYLYTTDTLTKKLQQERELRKELLPLAERMIVILGEHANEHYKELIKKAKLNN